jgi:hypothetical protein
MLQCRMQYKNVVWSDGPGDSDQFQSFGMTAIAYPDGRWFLIDRDRRELGSGDVGDMEAARQAAWGAYDAVMRAHDERAEAEIRAREQSRAAARAARTARPRKSAADQLQAVTSKAAHTRTLAAARRTSGKSEPGLNRDCAEGRLEIAQRDVRYAQSVVTDAQALPNHYPSKPGRVSKALAALELAHAVVELSEVNLENVR